MKSFLLYRNKPTIKFSLLDDEIFYEGDLPGKDYSLAVCPTDEKQVILDVDKKNNKNGFDFISKDILDELEKTFNYFTKSGGKHYFLNYTGNKMLMNTSTKYGLDLRIGANKSTKNAGGYVKYNGDINIRHCKELINYTDIKLNLFLESLFCGVNNK